jgi:hypothetical protein
VLPVDSGVHGIEPGELAEGPDFETSLARMDAFLQGRAAKVEQQ